MNIGVQVLSMSTMSVKKIHKLELQGRVQSHEYEFSKMHYRTVLTYMVNALTYCITLYTYVLLGSCDLSNSNSLVLQSSKGKKTSFIQGA